MNKRKYETERLLVPLHEAARLAGVGRTTFYKWRLAGLVECVDVAGRQMVRFESLKQLAEPKTAA